MFQTLKDDCCGDNSGLCAAAVVVYVLAGISDEKISKRNRKDIIFLSVAWNTKG
jgi:hypothetical protein